MPFEANCFQVGHYGEKIYIVCGYLSTGASNNVYEFDITTNEFTLLDVTFPKKIFKGAWCSVGKYMYLIGGTDGKRSDAIYRFDMENHIVEEMNAKLPDYISQSRAIYDGNGNIYIYGGTNERNELLNYIMKYDINDDVCTLLDLTLPYNLANLCVSRVNGCNYILGGENGLLNVILKHEENEIIKLKEVL
jgi:N-acetylneuraminic acid mutarotase